MASMRIGAAWSRPGAGFGSSNELGIISSPPRPTPDCIVFVCVYRGHGWAEGNYGETTSITATSSNNVTIVLVDDAAFVGSMTI